MTVRRTIDAAKRNEGGYALFSVTVFVFVLIIGSMTIFSSSNTETKMVIHDQNRTEAFYLADGAVERAKARLSSDSDWRDGWTDVSLGNGTYSLSIADSSLGASDGLYMIADGVVAGAHERLMLLAELRASGDSLALLVGDELETARNVTITPRVHVNGDTDIAGDLGGGQLTTSPVITPPTAFTEPSYWSNATYYDVRASLDGGVPHAVIYDGAGNDISAMLPSDLSAVMSYDSGSGTFTYDFNGDSAIDYFFDETSGVFGLGAGDGYVVVNFGNISVSDPPGYSTLSDVELKATGHTVLTTTIINTRFVGSTVEQRTDPDYWTGGETSFRVVNWEPSGGVAVLAHDFAFDTGHPWMGTEDTPALVFATDSIETNNGNPNINGAMTCLGTVDIGQNFTATFNPDLLGILPDFFVSTWPGTGDPELWVLDWRQLSVSMN